MWYSREDSHIHKQEEWRVTSIRWPHKMSFVHIPLSTSVQNTSTDKSALVGIWVPSKRLKSWYSLWIQTAGLKRQAHTQAVDSSTMAPPIELIQLCPLKIWIQPHLGLVLTPVPYIKGLKRSLTVSIIGILILVQTGPWCGLWNGFSPSWSQSENS